MDLSFTVAHLNECEINYSTIQCLVPDTNFPLISGKAGQNSALGSKIQLDTQLKLPFAAEVRPLGEDLLFLAKK